MIFLAQFILRIWLFFIIIIIIIVIIYLFIFWLYIKMILQVDDFVHLFNTCLFDNDLYGKEN